MVGPAIFQNRLSGQIQEGADDGRAIESLPVRAICFSAVRPVFEEWLGVHPSLLPLDQAERKQLLRSLVGEVKLNPQDLEVSISYRLPEAIMNSLVAGVCNAPNVFVIRFRLKLTLLPLTNRTPI